MNRLILLIIIFLSHLNFAIAHPLNTSIIDLDLNNTKPNLSVRFYIFNLKTPLMLNSEPIAQTVYDKKDETIKYIISSIRIVNNNKKCSLMPTSYKSEDLALIAKFNIICTQAIENLKIHYSLFFEFDKTQEGIMSISLPTAEKSLVFSKHQKDYSIKLSKPNNSSFKDFKNFVIEGMWHIWEGIDHIMFLLMLLIPALVYTKSFKLALFDVLKIVTAFTISHSITLSLSMFNILNPPEQVIETLIAISVLITALNNIYPLISYKKEWLLAFGFGFIHGFGFANAMHEINLNRVNFFSAVFGFNIGVEIGQIVIVLVILPIIYALSFSKSYKKIVIPLLSITVANISLLWAIDRAFALHFMPI